MKRKLTAVLMLVMILVMGSGSISASADTGRAVYYRGSVLMWTRDSVDFIYSGGKVISSSGYQEEGWIFPNIARNKGITRYEESSGCHKWRAHNSAAAGVPTPWGDISVYSFDFVHRLVVNGDGTWDAWSD